MLSLPHLKKVKYFWLKLYEWCSKDIEEDKTFYLKPLSIIVLNVQIQASINPTGFKQLFMRLNFILFKTFLRNGHYKSWCYFYPLLYQPFLLPLALSSLDEISTLSNSAAKIWQFSSNFNVSFKQIENSFSENSSKYPNISLLRKSQISHISESKSFIMV